VAEEEPAFPAVKNDLLEVAVFRIERGKASTDKIRGKCGNRLGP